MPAGAPGSSSRGRGGKFKKFTRGGGKHFSRDLQPVDAEGNQVSMWSEEAQAKEDDDDESEEESEEESEDEGDDGKLAKGDDESSREARKALKKVRKAAAIAKQKAKTVQVGDLPSDDEDSDDDDMPANPNHSTASRKQATKGATVDDITEGVKNLLGNRREREAAEAAARKERYMQLHAQGKTDEAKADLARLKAIREQRAAEAARRQAEKEEREEQERIKRAEIEAKDAKRREMAAGLKKSGKKK